MTEQIEIGHNWAAEQWDWPLQHNDGIVRVRNSAEGFEIGLDCQFFTPNEIEVKVAGNILVVHARHEQRSDVHGTVAREITRNYHLPEDVDPKTIRSHLSSRGVLTIKADKKK